MTTFEVDVSTFLSVYYEDFMEMDTKYFLFSIFFCGIMHIGAKEFYETIPKDTVCKILDPQIVFNFTCSTQSVNGQMSRKSQEITFQPGVVLHNYHLKIQLFRKFGKTFRPFLINTEQDFCAFASDNVADSSVALMKRMLNIQRRQKYGNWYQPCPISGRRYEKDVEMDNRKMPDVAIAGEHRFDITGLTYINGIRKEFSLTQYSGEVRSKERKGLK